MFSDEEISVFFDELEEKIQVLNENILILEREGESQDALQEIFRAAHTIKGSSAVMGYEKMVSLTHDMENLFDQMRKGLLPVSGQLVDTLFMALDTLQMLRDEIVGKDVSVDIEQVAARLKQCREAGPATPAPDAPADAGLAEPGPASAGFNGALEAVDEEVIHAAALKGYQAYGVTVELDSGCQMKSVRAFLVFETLQQLGEVIKSEPAAEDIQEGRFGKSFQAVLLTKEDPDRVRNLLMTVSEVVRADLSQIVLTNGMEAPKQAEPGAQAEKPERPAGGEHAGTKTVQTVRVDVQRLDTLMNLVGELVIDRTRLNRFAEIFAGRFGAGSGELVDTLNEISSHLGQVTGDLHEHIMKARMLPVAQVFSRFPRMVRDLAQKMNKEINFIVEGHETELDRNVIEIIGDPLIHLIRNAVDHGIEGPEERAGLGKPGAGTLKLRASYMENHIIITVQDDGRGLDPGRLRARAVEKGLLDREAAGLMPDREAMDLIFMPGFSTAAAVSDLSGRGVGMDIVRNQIENINGTVDISSALGVGTTFTIKLPLTLAIVRALMVELGAEQFAFPLANVVETITVQSGAVKKVKHNEVIVVRGHILPLVRLSEIFERAGGGEKKRLFVVVLGVGEKKIGVIVDRLLGEMEIVIKSLGDYLGKVPCLSGATILGDGQVALIIDVRSLVREIGIEETVYAAG